MATPYLTVNIIRMQTTTLRIRNCALPLGKANSYITHTHRQPAQCLPCVRVLVCACPSIRPPYREGLCLSLSLCLALNFT